MRLLVREPSFFYLITAMPNQQDLIKYSFVILIEMNKLDLLTPQDLYYLLCYAAVCVKNSFSMTLTCDGIVISFFIRLNVAIEMKSLFCFDQHLALLSEF
jgi:hypothetical protein